MGLDSNGGAELAKRTWLAVEPNDPDVLTADEAARWLGISPGVFIRWVDEGRIPLHVGRGGDRFFRRAELEALTVRFEPEPDEPEPDDPEPDDSL